MARTVRKHGLTAYASGECRCPVCREAWAKYHRLRRRAARRAGRRTRPVGRRREAYYTDQQRFALGLTPLAREILLAAEQRTQRPLDDIVEQLIRQYGPAVAA